MARRTKNFALAGSVPPTTSAANVYKSCSDSSDADDAADNLDGGNRKKKKKTGSNTNSTSSDLNVVHELRAEINRQRAMISALTSRLNFVLSMFSIDELPTCCERQELSYSQQVQQTVSQSGAMAGGSTSESAAASVTVSEAAHSSVKSLSPAEFTINNSAHTTTGCISTIMTDYTVGLSITVNNERIWHVWSTTQKQV